MVKAKDNADYIIHYSGLNAGHTELFFYDAGPDLVSLYDNAVGRLFVTDTNVAALPYMKDFCARFSGELLMIPAGETHKTIETVLHIVKTALEHNLRRESVFCAIGGGVVSDVTAFAASIFKRGAQLEIVPTTLLAMADAAVGGKTGCDFESYKNMLGSFYPARRIYFFPAFLHSLPEAEYRSGLAEVFKTALIFNAPSFELLKADRKSIDANLSPMIRSCVEAKAKIVEEDVTEQGRRALLNFGHTFAHALESVAGLGSISHGDAVAWGIGRALDLSAALELCSPTYRDEVFSVLASYGWETRALHPLLASRTVPPNSEALAADILLAAMKKDKKNRSEKIRMILQTGLAANVIQEVDEDHIRAVLTGR
jgi:3-dehydroquinate synthase